MTQFAERNIIKISTWICTKCGCKIQSGQKYVSDGGEYKRHLDCKA